jgi:hypothetical protein
MVLTASGDDPLRSEAVLLVSGLMPRNKEVTRLIRLFGIARVSWLLYFLSAWRCNAQSGTVAYVALLTRRKTGAACRGIAPD